MLIICHVCAEFHNKKGETVLTVSPDMLTGFISAPEEIQEDPLYGMLMADGSLEAGFTETADHPQLDLTDLKKDTLLALFS